MRCWWWLWAVLFGFGVACGNCAAQAAAEPWMVRPEWVRAHEEFLASDAMRGRGSATQDEEVAATYVASEFEGYGLTPASGMTRYVQTAQVVSSTVDGQARLLGAGLGVGLSAGQGTDSGAAEGADFDLTRSSGGDVSGPLVKLGTGGVAEVHLHRGTRCWSGRRATLALSRKC